MPKIKELDFTEEQIDTLFQQLSDSLKARLFQKWLDNLDTKTANEWTKKGKRWNDEQLKQAASKALKYYQDDPEMTAFTALDGEDFYESR
jgi:hypothetical protein